MCCTQSPCLQSFPLLLLLLLPVEADLCPIKRPGDHPVSKDPKGLPFPTGKLLNKALPPTGSLCPLALALLFFFQGCKLLQINKLVQKK